MPALPSTERCRREVRTASVGDSGYEIVCLRAWDCFCLQLLLGQLRSSTQLVERVAPAAVPARAAERSQAARCDQRHGHTKPWMLQCHCMLTSAPGGCPQICPHTDARGERVCLVVGSQQSPRAAPVLKTSPSPPLRRDRRPRGQPKATGKVTADLGIEISSSRAVRCFALKAILHPS